ncbi:MAG TPA: STAS domain-containing protein, partial [Isosphaeraceae bacterium]|nr:STAS domain-containing protein [Isosphaeraceae bacterium]
LNAVDYFGSMFLALLLRCWKLVQMKGGEMVLAGVSDRAKELLRITSLDMVWPIYATRREAMDALLTD